MSRTVAELEAEIADLKPYADMGKVMLETIEALADTGINDEMPKSEQTNAYIEVWRRQKAEIESLKRGMKSTWQLKVWAFSGWVVIDTFDTKDAAVIYRDEDWVARGLQGKICIFRCDTREVEDN